ncbi:MAG: MBOAT family protein [Myxococcota bacterium]|nr:MBOAT family protein [Myxococcota bacterium]
MLFNAPIFPLFFGVVYLLYRLSNHRAQNLLLLVASYFFYAWWDWRFLSLILLSTVVDYQCAKRLGSRGPPEKRWLWVSIVVNLGILATFKYLGWFVSEFQNILAYWGLSTTPITLELLLPVGLSFYTFQSMAYTIDVYRKRLEPIHEPLDFALFVSFFPQLVAGPIERAERLLPQIQNPRRIRAAQASEGAWLVVWGFFKKLVVADNLAVIVAQVFEEGPNSGAHVLIGMYAFTWQIYCDFSGYTDIARGISKLMGFELSINFRLPFFAKSPREIWRRWHISLSEWLRDYLYIPLGGSQKGRIRNAVNLFLTMILGGLWHGANWTFMVWGALHGGALALQRLLPSRTQALKGAGAVLAMVATFHLMAYGFLVFRAETLTHAGSLTQRIFTDFVSRPADIYPLTQLLALTAIPFLLEIAQYRRGDDLDLVLRWPRPVQAVCIVACALSIAVLGSTYGQEFIYFQF